MLIKACLCLSAIIAVSLCTGGWSDLPVDDAKVLDVTNMVQKDLNYRSNTMYSSKIVQIKQARRQLVAGFKWNIIFDFGLTDCLKSDTSKNLENCIVTQVNQCQVIVIEQPWLNKTAILDFTCVPSMDFIQTKPPIDVPTPTTTTKSLFTRNRPGSINPVAVNDPNVVKAAQFAHSELAAKDNCMYRSAIRNIGKAASQVVAGWKYYVTVHVGYTGCARDYVPKDESECPLIDSVQDSACVENVCDAEIWFQPWRNPQYVLTSDTKCKPAA